MVVNCDDFGMHFSINEAIGELLSQSLPLSVSLMPVGADFEDAVDRLRRLGISECGIHFAVTSEYLSLPFYPVAPGVLSLKNSHGALFQSVEEVRSRATLSDIRIELLAQLEKVERAGLRPTHFDSHMFFWEIEEWGSDALLRLAQEFQDRYRIPVRMKKGDGQTTPRRHFAWESHPDRQSRFQFYTDTFQSLEAGLHEFIVHPAKDLPQLHSFTGAGIRRIADYEFFRSSRWPSVCEVSGVSCVTWREV